MSSHYINHFQQEFEDSMESLDELIEQELSSCDDEDDYVEDFANPCYNEIMIDENGNYIKNFLGHVKE